MPLEKNTVRSVENFSTGGRGALSTEQFLKTQPQSLVVYFHRKDCRKPFQPKCSFEELLNNLTAIDGKVEVEADF